jgi:predicted small lipoprotein YifL
MKMKKRNKTMVTVQRGVMLLLAASMLILLASCGTQAPAETPPEAPAVLPAPAPSVSDDVQSIGQGSTVFRLEVTDDTGTVSSWDVHTDETTVGAALYAVGLIDSADFFVEVNGLIADFDADEAWWAFYINDEMATEGVGTASVEPGAIYSFFYTIGWG